MSRTFQEIKEEITAWQDKTFPQATPLSAVTHLQREIIELTFEVQIQHLKRKGTSELPKELADVFLLTVAVAHLSGINLEEAIAEKMKINLARTWGEPDVDGVVEHVREGKTLLEIFQDDGLIASDTENILIKNSGENSLSLSEEVYQQLRRRLT